MKIRRLDLIAYGPFQNEKLTFETDNLQLISEFVNDFETPARIN
jgi:uncharacterized protein YhaN